MSTHIVLLKAKNNWALYTATLTKAERDSKTFLEAQELPFVVFGLLKANAYADLMHDGQPTVLYMPIEQFGLMIVEFNSGGEK